MKKAKYDPDVIRLAAVTVYDPAPDPMGHFSCVALHRCATEHPCATSAYISAYQQIFSPDFGGDCGYWGQRKTREYQHQRSIALLLMAEMAATGDLEWL